MGRNCTAASTDASESSTSKRQEGSASCVQPNVRPDRCIRLDQRSSLNINPIATNSYRRLHAQSGWYRILHRSQSRSNISVRRCQLHENHRYVVVICGISHLFAHSVELLSRTVFGAGRHTFVRFGRASRRCNSPQVFARWIFPVQRREKRSRNYM